MLLGFANGQYGVATTHNVRLTTNSGYITLTTNEGDAYGVNRLSFKNQPAIVTGKQIGRAHV